MATRSDWRYYVDRSFERDEPDNATRLPDDMEDDERQDEDLPQVHARHFARAAQSAAAFGPMMKYVLVLLAVAAIARESCTLDKALEQMTPGTRGALRQAWTDATSLYGT